MCYFQFKGSKVILQILPAHAGLQAADLHRPICFAARTERRRTKTAPAIVSSVVIAPPAMVIFESIATSTIVEPVTATAGYLNLQGPERSIHLASHSPGQRG